MDSKFQHELRERFNPEGSRLRIHQLKMLEMLKFVDKICSDNNIPYWLASGTLLGAVRHEGFIPWDDDVDIEMLGKDYDRFVDIVRKMPDCQYVMQTHKTDSAYLYQFGKLRDRFSKIDEIYNAKDYRFKGVYIDLFPMDAAPRYCVWRAGNFFICRCLNTNKYNNARIRKVLRKILYAIFRVSKWMVKVVPNKSQKIQHRYGSVFYHEYDIADIIPVKKLKFEGYSFSVPNNYSEYLRYRYGDYMKLPDLDSLQGHLESL